jgi:hypothetical protein
VPPVGNEHREAGTTSETTNLNGPSLQTPSATGAAPSSAQSWSGATEASPRFATPGGTIDGTTEYPDFTIQTASGDEAIWEHLGIMANPKYAAD